MSADYEKREYLSVGEVAAYTGLSVPAIHQLVRRHSLAATRSAGGQYRFDLREVRGLQLRRGAGEEDDATVRIAVNDTTQQVRQGDSRTMTEVRDDSVHLAVTSPPYFNAKMYSDAAPGDLGNVHDLDRWLEEVSRTWKEIFRTLQPGRKFFLNIMNLPVRQAKSFRSLNLVGKNIDLCESLGFVFKRDIVWHKTNGVRAHFGTYPYPGGILINNMHEFILEFEKPRRTAGGKYEHVSAGQKERSKLDKEFWLSLKNSDVWLIKPEKSGQNRSHVAPFPVELPARLIRAFTFEGETVLDPFVGSGTTLVAAARFGRHGIGYDINPEFCRLAADRLGALNRENHGLLPFQADKA